MDTLARNQITRAIDLANNEITNAVTKFKVGTTFGRYLTDKMISGHVIEQLESQITIESLVNQISTDCE
jgi:hypothetical protein